MLIYTDEMRAVAEHLYIATDDGSEGFKGLVTQLFEQLIAQGRRYDECVAIGPMIMMKFVALTTAKYALKTTVSLNALMVDGTGMCGACRVRTHALHLRRRTRVRRPPGRLRRGDAPSGYVSHAGAARRGHRRRACGGSPM